MHWYDYASVHFGAVLLEGILCGMLLQYLVSEVLRKAKAKKNRNRQSTYIAHCETVPRISKNDSADASATNDFSENNDICWDADLADSLIHKKSSV